ncbi:MAG: hypothetical protein ABIM40_01665 [Pseudomonadota bacterium]
MGRDKSPVTGIKAPDLPLDLGAPQAPPPDRAPPPGLLEILLQEESLLDAWRSTLLRYMTTVADFVSEAKNPTPGRGEGDATQVLETLDRLDCMAEHDGAILIRHRGRPGDRYEENQVREDFIILFGPLRLDLAGVEAMARRAGSGRGMSDHFRRAANTLADAGITSLYASTRVSDPQVGRSMEAALEALAGYLSFLFRMSPEARQKAAGDPNLLLLAAVNGQKASAIQALAVQVESMMRQASSQALLCQYPSVYEAIFAFEKLRKTLIRPPLELNNVRWLISADASVHPTRQQADLARLAVECWGRDSQKTARVLDGLWGTDFAYQGALEAADRIGLASELLEQIEVNPTAGCGGDMAFHTESLLLDVYGSVETRLDRVSDKVLDRLEYGEHSIGARMDDGDFERPAEETLASLAGFFKQRAATKAKVNTLMHHAEKFDLTDHETIARDFAITIQDAGELVTLLEGCFDEEGRFVRSWFTESAPAFRRHEKKVFKFLWYYLKNHIRRRDRIAMLNGLKLLMDSMGERRHALTVLFEDLLRDPDRVQFSDRNALMLMNVLVRTFNQELEDDIQHTPEGVLDVRAGLDTEASAFVTGLLAGERERFYRKVRAIHGELKAPEKNREHPWEYLILLEREIYILLALAGGRTARTVLLSALAEYSDPRSEIFRTPESRDLMTLLLSVIQVLVRGLFRARDPGDLHLLRSLMAREKEFQDLASEPRAAEQVRDLFVRVREEASRLGVRH